MIVGVRPRIRKKDRSIGVDIDKSIKDARICWYKSSTSGKYILGQLLGRQILRLEVPRINGLGWLLATALACMTSNSDALSALYPLTQFTKYATERSPPTSRDSISVTLVLTVGMEAALASQLKPRRKARTSRIMKEWQNASVSLVERGLKKREEEKVRAW